MQFLNDLNSQQRDAVKSLDGPVLIVAGAGSGKTRVLTYRIAHLVAIGVPAYNILALTFTNKAANEMKARISALVGEKSSAMWMGTFHSMFARILRVECEHIGYRRSFTIYDDTDSLSLIKRIMNTLGIPLQQYNPNGIQKKISNAKNTMVTPEEFQKFAGSLTDEKAGIIYPEYQRQLFENKSDGFRQRSCSNRSRSSAYPEILLKYQQRFRFLLVDEYQDTNHVQYILLKTLASKQKNICVVGDDAQSIYAFRGADIRNILDFEKDYPEAKIYRLEQNYRSTKNILGTADRLIRHNQGQIAKSLWTDNDQGEPVHLIECVDDREEGAQIVQRISNDSIRFKIDLKHFAVLYRTNAQSRTLEDAFRKNSIPYVLVGGVAFYQRKEVKDVLAYLRVLANPQDTESLLRIINYPVRGLGDVAQSQLKEFAVQQSIPLYETLQRAQEIPRLAPKAKTAALYLGNFFKKYSNLQKEISLSELARTMVDEIGVLQLLKDEATSESMARWENIQEVLSAISEYIDEHPEGTLESFLEEVALVSDIDQWEDKHNAVTLMTLHSAKGLEFPVVFVTGLEEGLLPFYTTTIDQTELEEERRLLYVGITRAMRKLYLTHSRTRYRFGDVSFQNPSQFLLEVRGEGVEEYHAFKRFSERKVIPSQDSTQVKKKRERTTTDAFFADEMPDYEKMTDVTKRLRVGGWVEHETFGKGKVVNLTGQGEMMKASVSFEAYGTKQLMVKYAKLIIL